MSKSITDKLPLEEIRILDLTRLIPGAYCTSLLADVGADVIKIEEPRVGDYERQIAPIVGEMGARFHILNRNKESVAVNLKSEEGKQIFLKLVSIADVLVEGFRPGAMKKLGLDFESLQKLNPKLVYCSISSFGQDGPYKDVVAHDINILGMAGIFEITGIKDGPPVIPGLQIADSIAGINAALSILVTLVGREKTGKGQYIDTSMFDGVVSWLFDSARYVFAGEKVPGRGEGRLSGGFPNYSLYETKDGKYITVGSLETKFKNTLLTKLGREDLTDKGGSVTSTHASENDSEISTFLKETILTKTRDEWVRELEGLNICVGPVNSIEEALEHPQTLYRKLVVEDSSAPSGPIKLLGSPLPCSNPLRKHAPKLGEHTRKVLSTIGYGEEEMEAFKKTGVIRLD